MNFQWLFSTFYIKQVLRFSVVQFKVTFLYIQMQHNLHVLYHPWPINSLLWRVTPRKVTALIKWVSCVIRFYAEVLEDGELGSFIKQLELLVPHWMCQDECLKWRARGTKRLRMRMEDRDKAQQRRKAVFSRNLQVLPYKVNRLQIKNILNIEYTQIFSGPSFLTQQLCTWNI